MVISNGQWLWDALKTELDPGQDEEFVFENDHRFAKPAAQRMEEALKDLW